MSQQQQFRSSLVLSLFRLWRLAPRNMRRIILKGLLFRILQAFCLGGVFGVIGLWCYAFAVGAATSPGAIAGTCAALLLMLVLQFLFAYLSVGCIWLTSFRLVGAIRHRLLRRLIDLPMTFHLAQPEGDLANALTSDLSLIENLLTDGLPRLVHALSLPLLMLLIIAAMDPVTAALAILPVLATLPLLFLSCRQLARLSNKKLGAQSAAATQVLEWVEGMETVRTFGMFESGCETHKTSLQEIYRISVQMLAGLTAPLLGFSAVVITGLAVVVAATAYSQDINALSAAQTAAILALSVPLYVPLLGLAQFMELAAVAQGAIDRLNPIMLAKPAPRTEALAPVQYAITLENAGFRFSQQRQALRPLSVKIPECGLTAIVGPSGAGKSTLLHLMAGLLQPSEGRVLIGGVDIRDISSRDLDRLVSVVFQNVVLFSGTVRDNIAIGNPAATSAEMENAARNAGAHAFIEALPHGYDTQIGEGGKLLSGGERQRLSLARAVFKNTPIILVDEGTSSVDNLTGQEIASALQALARNRSVIMVTHTLSAFRGVDRIIDLRDR